MSGATSPERRKVVFLSHTADGGTFKVGSHHLAREFSIMGYDVVHFSTPWSRMHDLLGKRDPRRQELAVSGPTTDEHGVMHLSSYTLLPASVGLTTYLTRALGNIGFGDPDIVIVDQPLMVGKAVHQLGKVRVYRPTDLYPKGLARQKQKRFLRYVHGVVATSSAVLNDLPANDGLPSLIIENGVDFNHFASFAPQTRRGVVYVGALDHRFDWSLLKAVAKNLPEVPFSIAGPLIGSPGVLPPNVKLLGPIPYSHVPKLLAESKVGFLPMTDVRENQGRSPMKMYEYLAAGLFVTVSRRDSADYSELPGVREVVCATDATDAIYRQHGETLPNEDGRITAGEQDWAAKARQLHHFISALGT